MKQQSEMETKCVGN